MNWGKYALETATLIVAATVCALVANSFASRERKLVVVSQYSAPSRPNVTPALQPAPPVPAGEPAPTSSAPSPATPPPATRQPITRQPVTRQPANDPRQPVDRFQPHPDKPYIEIKYDDVAWLHDKGVLFLDARRTSVYEEGHIAGARPFSVWESDIDDKVNKLYAERSDPRLQNEPIVVYCSGGDCEDSHMLAQKLWGIQFNNVYVYKDGFPDWQQHGGAIDRGSKP